MQYTAWWSASSSSLEIAVRDVFDCCVWRVGRGGCCVLLYLSLRCWCCVVVEQGGAGGGRGGVRMLWSVKIDASGRVPNRVLCFFTCVTVGKRNENCCLRFGSGVTAALLRK